MSYTEAKQKYAAIGVDTEMALDKAENRSGFSALLAGGRCAGL